MRRRGGRERPLTFLVGALTPVLEGMLVVLVVSGVLMGALLRPRRRSAGVVSPASLAIVVVWLGGVYVINRVRKEPALERLDAGQPPGTAPPPPAPTRTQPHPFATQLDRARGVRCSRSPARSRSSRAWRLS